ncbi:MAG: aldo/keto reductase [Halobacteriota archaeon]
MTATQLGHLDIESPGLGTLRIDETELPETVRTAIDIGYRTIDAAQMYGNQQGVGKGIASAPVSRDELFLESKILHPKVRDTVDVDQTIEDAHECLDHLGVDYLDALYIHWPDDHDFELAFEAFDALSDEGVFRHLGLSNFTPELIDECRELAAQPIEVLQVEMHPLLQQEELRDYCAEHDIAMVAYCPVIRGKVVDVPELVDIAAKHDASPFQVSIAWIRSKGVVPIPTAIGPEIRENWEARDLELDDEDVQKIDAIDREERQVDPPYAAW